MSAGDVDHLDTLSAYYTPSFQLEWRLDQAAGQLLPSNNITSGDHDRRRRGHARCPTKANGGITSNGLTYTFHIRPGVDWNTSPPRQVTSADFEREFKAMCNPTLGVGNPLYYVPVIKGMSSLLQPPTRRRSREGKSPSASAHDARSRTALDLRDQHAELGDDQFTLTSAGQRLPQHPGHAVRLGAAGRVRHYLPDSAAFRAHTLSDGPYAITTYTASKKIVLSRNPAWKQSTDPLRHQYVNQIVVNEGTTSNQTALADVQAGTDDLMWDLPVPTSSIPSCRRSTTRACTSTPTPAARTRTSCSTERARTPTTPCPSSRSAGDRVRDQQGGHREDLRRHQAEPDPQRRDRAGQRGLHELQLLPDAEQRG